jgi:hypothetical protein
MWCYLPEIRKWRLFGRRQKQNKEGNRRGKLGDRITPAGYLLWASDSSIAVPEELKLAVEARNEIPNWEARYDDLVKQHKEGRPRRRIGVPV